MAFDIPPPRGTKKVSRSCCGRNTKTEEDKKNTILIFFILHLSHTFKALFLNKKKNLAEILMLKKKKRGIKPS